MGSARPTIHDVAARAGVSKSLVSLAMRGSPKVSEASREAILTAATELGYRPNAAARTLADRHSRTIGVLILDLHNPVFAEILDGVQAELRRHDYRTMLVTGDADPALEQASIEALLEHRVEGLLLISHRLPAARLRTFAAEAPTVVVARRDVAGPRIDTIAGDDVAGAGLAVDHLVALGHTRITCLTGGDNPVSRDRERGYREAMARHGLDANIVVVPGGLTDAAGYAAARVALEQRPTALFAANDLAAMGALAAVHEAGLGVPEDVSVVGYDGIAIGALRRVDLTTVAQPLHEMGALAANRLLDRIAQPDASAEHVVVPTTLAVRGTTGPTQP
jgi:DNA-binding LacI/PurR family transcriptional regulator